MSTTVKQSPENNLEKFLKFLCLKSVQIIVQARLGHKILTKSTPHGPGSDWFNIAIPDHPEVLAETKKALQISQTDTIANRLPLCVEISLQTVEGDKMILEVWSLNLHTDQSDPTVRATYTVYSRMGILLKSLISVTRVLPSYKLSRRQSTDSYNIYYRIYVDQPQVHNLGDGHIQKRVGQLCTPLGTISMAVAYRTKMTISPTQTGRDTTIMLKSDHFRRDLSPKHIRYTYNNKKNEKKIYDLDKPMRCGAFVDASRIKQFTEDDFSLPETPPFSWLLRKTKEEMSIQDEQAVSPVTTPTEGELVALKAVETATTTTGPTQPPTANNNNANVKSFESQSPKAEGYLAGTSPTSLLSESKRPSRWTIQSGEEDEKLLKELQFPFATTNTAIGDLAKFYRECFNAPPLQQFNDVAADDENSIEDLTKQLEQFETSMENYDTLVTSLCCQSVDSNSNS